MSDPIDLLLKWLLKGSPHLPTSDMASGPTGMNGALLIPRGVLKRMEQADEQAAPPRVPVHVGPTEGEKARGRMDAERREAEQERRRNFAEDVATAVCEAQKTNGKSQEDA